MQLKSLINRWNIIVLAIFICALAIRLFLAVAIENTPDFSDMQDYNELAVEGGFNTYLPPFYPLFLRLIYSIFGTYNYTAVFIAQSIISSLIIILVYDIVRRISNNLAGVIAALICSVYPNLIIYNLTTMTESLSLFIVVFLLWLMLIEFNATYKALALAAVLVAGSLIKSSIIFFLPGTLFFTKKRKLLVLFFIILISPWIIRNVVMHDKLAPVSDTGALNFYATYNPAATGSRHTNAEDTPLKTYDHKQMTYVKEALKFIIHNKRQTMDITYNKLSILVSRGFDSYVLDDIVGDNENWKNLLIYGYIPISILGIIGLIRLYDKENRFIAVLMFSYLILSIFLAIFKYRYRVLVEPMLIIYASMLIAGIIKSFSIENSKAQLSKGWENIQTRFSMKQKA